MSDNQTEDLEQVVAEMSALCQRRGIVDYDVGTLAPALSAYLIGRAHTGEARITPADLLHLAIEGFEADFGQTYCGAIHPARRPPPNRDLGAVLRMQLNCSMGDQLLTERQRSFSIPSSVSTYYQVYKTSSSRFRTEVVRDVMRIFAHYLVRPSLDHAESDVFALHRPTPYPISGSTFLHDASITDVDIVCSEIPGDERPYYSAPGDRNYLRYARFADLDSLVYLRSMLPRAFPKAHITDYVASEYPEREPDLLLVVGGPPWNSKSREVATDLPFHFEPHPLGHDDPLYIHGTDIICVPSYSPSGRVTSDVSLLSRRNIGPNRWLWLFAGCLTLGVLGACMTFLDPALADANTEWLSAHLPWATAEFVLVFRTWKGAGNVALSSFETAPPLALLARSSPMSTFERCAVAPE